MGHGIAVVDPAHVNAPARPPTPHVEAVLVDGAEAQATSAVTLAPGARRIELRYSGVDLSDGPGVRFRYRLDGFDTAWTDAGPQRVASYTRLAAGRYRFRVTARAGQGGWNAAEAWTEVEVESPVYRRSWFVGMVGAVLSLTLWGAHRAVLRTRLLAVRAERSRMAREIHDSLLQGFGGIALQLHAASARLALAPAQQPLIDRVLTLIDHTLSEARERVWDLRRPDGGSAALAADCEAAATRILADSGTTADVVCHGRTRRLSPAAHAETLRIVQEALTNVRKHAAATAVRITLDYRWRALRLTVRDNGRGSDAALLRRPGGHWGILGMRERAGRIGARLALQSRPGEGTVVALTVGYARGMWTRRERPAGDAAAAED
jgi:signal transduction histidine kinase